MSSIQRLTSKNNVEVLFRPNTGHILQHKDCLPFLEEAIARAKIPIDYPTIVKLEIYMNKVIGVTHCVQTYKNDEIVYAPRKGREIVSRFVKNRESDPCDHLTIVLKRVITINDTVIYRLITAYIGFISEMEVGDRNIRTEAEKQRCADYWSNHALVWGSQEIIS